MTNGVTHQNTVHEFKYKYKYNCTIYKVGMHTHRQSADVRHMYDNVHLHEFLGSLLSE
jgi:hypothetical protein